LRRVTLAGTQSLVRSLPTAFQGENTDPGYRLVNDTLVIIGKSISGHNLHPTYEVVAVPVPAGDPHVLTNHGAYWQVGSTRDVASPDGKWIALGSIGVRDGKTVPQWAVTSTDGATFRLLGSTMGCDAWPEHWLPDSRAFVAVGVDSCDDWRGDDRYIVPVDGSPAKRINVPPNQGYAVTPDGRSLLVAVNDAKIGSLIAFDVSKVIGASPNSGKRTTSSTP